MKSEIIAVTVNLFNYYSEKIFFYLSLCVSHSLSHSLCLSYCNKTIRTKQNKSKQNTITIFSLSLIRKFFFFLSFWFLWFLFSSLFFTFLDWNCLIEWPVPIFFFFSYIYLTLPPLFFLSTFFLFLPSFLFLFFTNFYTFALYPNNYFIKNAILIRYHLIRCCWFRFSHLR